MITSYKDIESNGELIHEIPLKNFTLLIDKNGLPYGYLEFPFVWGETSSTLEQYLGGESFFMPSYPYYIFVEDKCLIELFVPHIYIKKSSQKSSIYYCQISNFLGDTLSDYWGQASGNSSSRFRWRKFTSESDTYYPSKIALENMCLALCLFSYRIRQRNFHSNLTAPYDPGSNAICLNTGGQSVQSFGATLPDAIIQYVWDNIFLIDVKDPSEVNDYNASDLGARKVYFIEATANPMNYIENRTFYICNRFPETIPSPGDKINGETIETIIFKQNHIELYTDYTPNYTRQQITGQSIERQKRVFPRSSYYTDSWFSSYETDALLGYNDLSVDPYDDINPYCYIGYQVYSFLSPTVIKNSTPMKATSLKAKVVTEETYNFRIILSKPIFGEHGIWLKYEKSYIDTPSNTTVTFTNLSPGELYYVQFMTLSTIPKNTDVYMRTWVEPSCLVAV